MPSFMTEGTGIYDNKQLLVTTNVSTALVSVTVIDGYGSGWMFFPHAWPETTARDYYEHIAISFKPAGSNPNRILIAASQTTNFKIFKNETIIASAELNNNQIYTYTAAIGEDVSGMIIVTDRPALVVSGSSLSLVPSRSTHTFGDSLQAQLPATKSLGMKHIVPPNEHQKNPDGIYYVIRVFGVEAASVTITYNSSVTGINNNTESVSKGSFYELEMAENVPALVVCSKPCFVVRYIANGEHSTMNVVHDLSKAWTIQKFRVTEAAKLVIVSVKLDYSSLRLNGLPITPLLSWDVAQSSGKVLVLTLTKDVTNTLTSTDNDTQMLAWASFSKTMSMFSLTLTSIEYQVRMQSRTCPVFKRSTMQLVGAGPLQNMTVPRLDCWRNCQANFWCHYVVYDDHNSRCELFTTASRSTGIASTKHEFVLN